MSDVRNGAQRPLAWAWPRSSSLASCQVLRLRRAGWQRAGGTPEQSNCAGKAGGGAGSGPAAAGGASGCADRGAGVAPRPPVARRAWPAARVCSTRRPVERRPCTYAGAGAAGVGAEGATPRWAQRPRFGGRVGSYSADCRHPMAKAPGHAGAGYLWRASTIAACGRLSDALASRAASQAPGACGLPLPQRHLVMGRRAAVVRRRCTAAAQPLQVTAWVCSPLLARPSAGSGASRPACGPACLSSGAPVGLTCQSQTRRAARAAQPPHGPAGRRLLPRG